jgi:hypothetical protein
MISFYEIHSGCDQPLALSAIDFGRTKGVGGFTLEAQHGAEDYAWGSVAKTPYFFAARRRRRRIAIGVSSARPATGSGRPRKTKGVGTP